MPNDSNSHNPVILLVDDDEVSRDVIKLYLKGKYSVDSVSSGAAALEKTKHNKYTLILMDINLKGMSGLETTQKIKKNENYSNVPVVAITAYAMAGDRERILKGGCTHYISKPFVKRELLSLLEEILKS